MKRITDLSSDAKQKFKIQIDGGSLASFEFWFSDNNIGWYFNLEYEGFKVNNLRLVTSPNCINTYKNILPFGLMCSTNDGYEPWFIDDFVKGRVSVFILTADEVELIQENIYARD